MPRPAKPWWDATKRQWACRHRGVYTPLGDGDYEDALAVFHRVKAATQRPVGDCKTVAQVFERYLRTVQANKSPATYKGYQRTLSAFDRWLGEMDVDDFRPAALQEWLDEQPKRIKYTGRDGKPKTRTVTWTDTTKSTNASTIQVAFAWARRMKLIADDPLADFQKPARRRREGIVSDATWATLMERFPPGDAFRDVLTFCMLSGCRPQEVRAIELRHIAADRMSIRFAAAESKTKLRPRTIYLSEESRAIIDRLTAGRTDGYVFRTKAGKPWNKESIRSRLRKAGVGKLNLGMLRKTWETAALKRLPLAVVAELAGHNPSTALQHYSHLAESSSDLSRAAQQASQPVSPRSKTSGNAADGLPRD